ncbi:MAG TPA: hypothetical protein PKE59_14280 [Novosphingobium sp.]|jgi:hypothetical protein|nr:hypothetical protein [Novosphingobium sp.]
MMFGQIARPGQVQVLRNLTLAPECWGQMAGEKIGQVLINRIAAAPDDLVWHLSLKGVTRIDVTFAARALVRVVQHFRASRRICLVDLESEDVAANIAAAAERMDVPVTVWHGERAEVLGPAPSATARSALAFALGRRQTFARDLAAAQHMSITNASTRLRHLWERGYLMREEVRAPSGGCEFAYAPIG